MGIDTGAFNSLTGRGSSLVSSTGTVSASRGRDGLDARCLMASEQTTTMKETVMLSNVGKGSPNDVGPCCEIGATLISQRRQSKSLPTLTPEAVPAVLARARQSAILAERNRLAGEIHDGLAQVFTVICMQLGVAEEELSAQEGDPLGSVQRALELANFGLAEARRFAHKLRSNMVHESGLTEGIRRLVERSSVPGRLRCDFRSDDVHERSLPPRVQHELLRITQEAIHNAVRHAGPTVISVALRWHAPNLVLQVKDDGSGIAAAELEKNEGFGLANMRERASEIDGRLEIQTAVGQGTTIVVTVPVPLFQFDLAGAGRWIPGRLGWDI
jgi:signal transduction histidine kinase